MCGIKSHKMIYTLTDYADKKSGGLASSPTKKIRRVGVLADQKNPEGWRPRQPKKSGGLASSPTNKNLVWDEQDKRDFRDKKSARRLRRFHR